MSEFQTFEEYLDEAVVSSQKLGKMVNLFMRYAGKKLKKDYGVIPDLFDLKRGGKGKLVILSDGSAIRFNWIKGEIQSITLFAKYKNNKKGDRTIKLNGLNVIQVARRLVEIIRKKSYVGKEKHYIQPMYEDEKVSYGNMLSEAKQVKPDIFASMLKDGGKVKDLSTVTWGEIEATATANDVKIPLKIRRAPTNGKGASKTWDLREFIGGVAQGTTPPKTKETGDIAPINLEVVKGDVFTIDLPDWKIPDKYAEQIAAVNVEKMTDLEYMKSRYRKIETAINAVMMGSTKIVVLVGGPGLGKSYTTTMLMKKHGWTGPETAADTPAQLYKVLFMNRHPGDIILFDDSDAIMDDEKAVNMMKRATVPNGVGTVLLDSKLYTTNVSQYSEEEKEAFINTVDQKLSAGEDDVKLPNSFEYRGGIVFISNRPKAKFNSAILNRGLNVDMDLTPNQIFLRIEEVLDDIPDAKMQRIDLTMDEKMEVLDVAKALYVQKLESVVKKWNAEAGSKLKQRKLTDPKNLLPTLRYLSAGLEAKYISKFTPNHNWIELMSDKLE